MTVRLASSVTASALMRIAQTQGGFATVIAKGDPDAGQLLLLILEKGQFSGFFERQLGVEQLYEWKPSGPQIIENTREISEYCQRRRARDGDLWIIELDVPDAAQLVARFADLC